MGDSTSEPTSTKDSWDRAGIVAQALVPALLAIFTFVYGTVERRQDRQQAQEATRLEHEKEQTLKATTVISILDKMPAGADSLKMPVISAVLTSLGYSDVALKIATAQTRPTPSSVTALRDLTKADSAPIATAATQALTEIARSGGGGDTAVAMQALNVLAQSAATNSTGPEWAIVTGRYGSLAEANAAADSSRKLGFPTGVFVRNNAPRTAIRFPARSVARTALPLVQARIRNGAYGVNWLAWCPTPTSAGDHVVCGRSAPEQPLDQ